MIVSRSQTLSSQGAYRLSSLIDKRPVTKGSGYARLGVMVIESVTAKPVTVATEQPETIMH